jgi:hypothetical protein
MLRRLNDLLWLLLLAGVCIHGQAPRWQALLLFAMAWAGTWPVDIHRKPPEQRLRQDQRLTLACLFLLLTGTPTLLPGAGASGWWLVAPAVGLAATALVSTFADHRAGLRWSRARKGWMVAALAVWAAGGLSAALARGVLAFRSTVAIPPGAIDFWITASIWLLGWFGVDTHVRHCPAPARMDVLGQVWGRRHALTLLPVAIVLFFKG